MSVRAYERIKRMGDALLSMLALVLLFPVLALLALAVRFSMGAPVLFRQTRAGLRGCPFTMFKFRTMRNAVDGDGHPLPDELRLTPLGLFLRRSSLDELPELFNVLCGDMSLVGPRPLLMEYLAHYTPEQMRRHDAPPGLTGWAQVNGRNSLSWPERFTLDVWYVDNRSLLLDAKILWMTIAKVVRREGISAEGCETMPKFTESVAGER
jgi:lipopolysaccharide/colanic/teichoic acid biosynthesis glycosyltransferase